ncbi:membrane dipeptidase-domain-containing protein [Auriculariales sp. MPI-PUGE-AT-0066]|nr:membrane dipeptidase-domain-containing protein [Auriculariales sp. MPI-PUGE-AT-0066]
MSSPTSQGHEHEPLLPPRSAEERAASEAAHKRTRKVASGLVLLVFIASLVFALWRWEDGLPQDPIKAANKLLAKAPVIDGHIDLPWLTRELLGNNVSAIDLATEGFPGHLDIPRLRKGHVGGFFWSVFTPCEDTGVNFTAPTNSVRDTLEQIDVAKLLIDKYPTTFALALGTQDVKLAIFGNRIASMLGIEGGHQFGNSLSTVRAAYALGVRYATLTHSCHNVFADSAGILIGIPPLHGGLSPLGVELVKEMNRLGMLVDLSHTSDDTARQALKVSRAPVIWSHSSARAVHNVPRNVPDDILKMVGTGKNQKDGVVMVNFATYFVAPEGKATLEAVADHVHHIGKIAGRKHVGIGSDYDGIDKTPFGLEDVSKYPMLFAELYRRGWTARDLVGLAGGNLIRVWEGAEAVARELQEHEPANMARYAGRPDLPKPQEL